MKEDLVEIQIYDAYTPIESKVVW